MTPTLAVNLLLVLLCAAVSFQSARMMLRIREMKATDLHGMITGLDRATGEARNVLEEMRTLLTGDMASAFRTLRQARELHDELTVIIGIGDSLADRIIEASIPTTPDAGLDPVDATAPALPGHPGLH